MAKLRALSVGQFGDSYMPTMDGVVTVIKNYAYWLNKKHCDCIVAVPKTPGYEIRESFPVLPFISFPAYGREPYRVGVPGMDFRYHRQIRAIDLDLVHAHTPFVGGMEATRLARERKIPLVATFHSKYYDDFLNYFGRESLARQALIPVVRFYEKADVVWTVSNSTVDTLREYGYRGSVDVIPNGTDVVLPDNPALQRERVQRMCALGDDEPLLLFVGQHIVQKNTPMLIRAFARYKSMGGRAKLAMVGQGNAREELGLLALEHGVGDSITFCGPVLDKELLNGFYQRASLFAFPSLYDNAPLVVREAAAMGCPSLMIANSTAAEIIEDNVNGFLCENGVESISARLASLFAEPETLKRAGERARETIVIEWERIVDDIYARYQGIVSSYVPRRIRRVRLAARRAELRRRRRIVAKAFRGAAVRTRRKAKLNRGGNGGTTD